MVQLLLYLFVQALSFSFFIGTTTVLPLTLTWIEMYEPEEIVGAFNIAVWLNYISLAPLCVIIKILTVFLDENLAVLPLSYGTMTCPVSWSASDISKGNSMALPDSPDHPVWVSR